MITGILLGDGISKQKQWQILKYKGKPVLLHCLEAMYKSNLDQILLVVGKNYHLILNRLKIPSDERIRILMNHRFERGLSSYLKLAMMSLPQETDAIMVSPGEFPLIDYKLLNTMLDKYNREMPGMLVPVCEKELGFPIIFGKKYFKSVRRLAKNDVGGSLLKKFRQDVTLMEVDNAGVYKNLDRLRQYETEELQEVQVGKMEGLDIPDKKRVEKAPEKPEAAEKPEVTRSQDEGAAKAGPVKVPLLREQKKEIIDQLKEKIENRVREQKDRLIRRKPAGSSESREPSQSPKQSLGVEKQSPHLNLNEGARRRPSKLSDQHRKNKEILRKAATTKPVRGADTSHLNEKARDTDHLKPKDAPQQQKSSRDLTLKKLNDLLGKRKEK